MFANTRLRRRRAALELVLEGDLLQPAGWGQWLTASSSIKELHQRCPYPGWLAYCGYLSKVSTTRLLEGTLALARLAAAGDARAPLSVRTIERLQDNSWPELADVALGLEQQHQIARVLVDSRPSEICGEMMPLYDGRIELRQLDRAVDQMPAQSLYRSDVAMWADSAPDGLVAAGYVFAIEAIYLNHAGLRDAVASRSAAAAALLCGSHSAFRDTALQTLCSVYGW